VVEDHGDGNTGKLPLRTAVGGMPPEAREREALWRAYFGAGLGVILAGQLV